MRGASQPGPPMPFIVGVGRSGTTLLRLMLDAHPQLAIPPETHFVPPLLESFERLRVSPERAMDAVVDAPSSGWEDLGLPADEMLDALCALKPLNSPDAVRAFYRAYASRHGKPRYGDKTPRYVTRMKRIAGALPEARFIHVIRDGRDVLLSLNKRLVELRDSEPVPVERFARRWRRRVKNAHRAELGDRYTELRYEDLVTDTEPTLRRVCALIDLEFDPVMLDYHEHAAERLEEMNRDRAREGRRVVSGAERMTAHARTAAPPSTERVYAWKREMSAEDRRAFDAVAGDLLAELGYEVSLGPISPPTWRRFGRKSTDDAQRAPFPFVVGMNRSGTTLLRMMLDAHPQLTIPPETHFVPDLIRALRKGGGPGGRARRDERPSRVGRLRLLRRGGTRLAARGRGRPRGVRTRLLPRLRGPAGEAAMGREDAALRDAACARSSARCPRLASFT